MTHKTPPPNNEGWLSWTGSLLAASLPKSVQRIFTLPDQSFSTAPESINWHNRSVTSATGIVEIHDGEEKPLEPVSSSKTSVPGTVGTIAKLATGLFAAANIPGVSATNGLAYLSTIASEGIPKGISWALGSMGALSPSIFWGTFSAFSALPEPAQFAIGAAAVGAVVYGAQKAKQSLGTPASITMTSPESITKMQTYDLTITCSNGRRFQVSVNLAEGLENSPELSQIEEFWKTTVLEPLSNESYDIKPGDELNITFTDDGWIAERTYKDEQTRLAAQTVRREPTLKREITNPQDRQKIETLKEITNKPDYPKAKIVETLNFATSTQTGPYIPRFRNRGADCWLNSAMQMYLSIPEFKEAMEDEHNANQQLKEVMQQCRRNEPIITLGGLIPGDDGEQKDVGEGFAALERLFQFPAARHIDQIEDINGTFIQNSTDDPTHHIINFPVPNLGPNAAPQDFKELAKNSLRKPLDGGMYQSRVYQEVPKVLNFSGIRNGPGENGQFGVRSDTKIDIPMTYELHKKHLNNDLQNTPDRDLNYELMSFAVQLPSLPGTVDSGHWMAYQRVVCFDQTGTRKDRFYRANDTVVQEISEDTFKRTAQSGSSWLYRQQKFNEGARPLQPIQQLQQPPLLPENIVPPPTAQSTLIKRPLKQTPPVDTPAPPV